MNKKKLTVNRLAMGNLKARKKQYTLMIIGIVLAMIFSSGVMFFLFSLSSSIQELNDKKIGKQDALLNASQNYDMDYLFESKTVKDHGFANVIGYGYTDEKSPEQGTSIARLDEKAEEISYIKAKEGRMPEKKGEIAIEYDALNRLGLFYAEIGDKITLKFKIANGDGYLPEETEKTYTLVGKLWDKRPNIEYNYGDRSFYPSAVVSNDETVDLGGKENVICFMTIKNANLPLDGFMEAGIAAGIKGEEGYFDNFNCILTTSNRWAFNEKYDMKFTLIIAIILSSVLMIASCTGIVNAFNTNLLERKKQIGMLRAVGATKRQIIKIFGREAFLIAAVTTPVSLAVSYFSVKAIIGAMGDNFVFIPEWWVLILCGLFGVVCVMAAAFIPLYIASRVSPMQAIRNTELMRKMKNKRIRSKKEFNAPKLIAKRNLVFYRKKQAAVSVILIATIVFTSLGFSLLSYTLKYDMDNYLVPSDYHIQNQSGGFRFGNIRSGKGFSENDRQEILSHPYVSDIIGRKSGKVCILTEEYTDYMHVIDYMYSERFMINGGFFDHSFEDFLNNIYGKTETDYYSNIRKEIGFSEHLFPTTIHSFELSEFTVGMEKAVYEGEINIEKLNSGEEIILYAPDKIGFHRGEETYGTLDMDKYEKGEVLIYGLEDEDIKATAERDYKVGDTIKISTLISNSYPEDDNHPQKDTERYDREVKIAAIITDDSECDGYFRGDYLDFFTTLDGFDKIVPDYKYWSFDININTECTTEIDEEMTAFLKSFNAGNDMSGYFHSKFASDEENRKTVAGVLVAILSIAILFFCICASVINNQLTAQIRENKREIGTLRAVGASAKELTQSYFRQLLSMFGWGCGIGFGLYTVIWFIMYLVDKYINFSSRYYPYQIWEAVLICLLLLAICFVNLYSKVKNQMKYSIVENIREL